MNSSILAFVRSPAGMALTVLFAAVFAVYLPSLSNALVFDDAIITSGQLMAEYGGQFSLKARVLSYTTIVWLQKIAGDAWWLQRLFNIALHLGVVAMLYVFYRALLTSLAAVQVSPAVDSQQRVRTEWALLIGVAWYALNPTAVYAVAYLTQRSIVMATLFSLISLWAVLRALATRRRVFWLIVVLAYVAAMLSKEYALALPGVIVALVVLIRRPSPRQLLTLGTIGVMFAAIAARLLYSRYGSIIGQVFDDVSLSYVKQLAVITPGIEQQVYPLSIINQMWLYFEYACRWLLPSTQMMSVDLRTAFPTQLLSVPHVLGVAGYVAILAGSVTLMLRYRDARALLGFCLFLPTVLFVTEFSTVWVQDPFVLYRSYLWAIAVPGLIYLGVQQLFARVSSSTVLLCAGAVGAIMLWQTTDRIASFRTELSVWDDATRKLPPELVVGKSRSYLNRGQAYQLSGDDNRAIRDYRRSTAFGDNGEGLLNAGSVLLARGRFADAIAAFDGAVARGQRGASLSLNRGTALLSAGDATAALGSLQEALTLGPTPQEVAAVRRQRAIIFLQAGRIDEAIADAQFAAAAFTEDWQVRNTLGFALLAKATPGSRAEAITVFNESLKRNPSGNAYFGLARAHAEEKRVVEARTNIDKALVIEPANTQFQQFQAKLR